MSLIPSYLYMCVYVSVDIYIVLIFCTSVTFWYYTNLALLIIQPVFCHMPIKNIIIVIIPCGRSQPPYLYFRPRGTFQSPQLSSLLPLRVVPTPSWFPPTISVCFKPRLVPPTTSSYFIPMLVPSFHFGLFQPQISSCLPLRVISTPGYFPAFHFRVISTSG